jgi:restriction endonuclease S subunit
MAYLDPEFSPLPDGWTSKELQDVVEIHNTKRQPLNGREREGCKGSYPYCGANGVVDYIDDYRFDGEYVLIAEDGGYWGKHQPSSYIMRGKFWVNNHAHVVCAIPTETTNTFFSNIVNYLNIDPFIGGDARGKLTKAILTQLAIPLPPLPEQKKIAHILSTVQRAIEAQERIIQTTTELKKALMHKLFTEGLRHEPQKQTEIGPIPESWEVVKLGEIAKVGNGSTPKRANEAYWDGGTIPWLNSTKIHDRFIIEADQFVTPQAVKECHLPKVAPNSLLIAITGQGKTLGNSAITRIETCINQHLAYAQFHAAKIVPDFVLWFMQTRYDYLRSIAHGGGSTKGALTCGFLKTLPIPVPSRADQEEIATTFQTLEDKQASAVRKRAALQDLFRTLLHYLMTAQIRTGETTFKR